MESPSIVNRTTPQFQRLQGYSPRLYILTSKPPGPWARVSGETGLPEWWDLPPEAYSHGSMVGVRKQHTDRTYYVKLYVYVDSPYDPSVEEETSLHYAWNHWKLVDLNWPKIDPDTGAKMDQFSNWPGL